MLALIILCILLTWLLCAAVCIGIGSLLLRALRVDVPSHSSLPVPQSSFLDPSLRTGQNDSSLPTFKPPALPTFQHSAPLQDSLWTGIAILTAILQIYHFFRPIDLVAVYLLLGLALAGWLWNYAFRIPDASAGRSSLLSFSSVSTFNFQLSTFLLLSVAAAIIAFRAVGPCVPDDT